MTVPTMTRVATGRAFVAEVARLLPKAEASGDRLITALYLILVCHPPRIESDGQQRSHLACAECRPDEPAAGGPVPLPDRPAGVLGLGRHPALSPVDSGGEVSSAARAAEVAGQRTATPATPAGRYTWEHRSRPDAATARVRRTRCPDVWSW